MRFRSGDKRRSRFVRRPLLSLSSFLLAIAVGLISSFTFSAAYDMAHGAFSGEHPRVTGTWHGRWRGVHAVTVRLEQGCGSLTGTARFSRIMKTDEGLKVIGESVAVPLINPQLSGESLTFEVQDPDVRRTTEPVRMEMRFTKSGEAELWRDGEKGLEGEEPATIIMLQERSF